MIISYTLIIFSALIYTDRILINDILIRVQFLIGEYKWIDDMLEVHSVLYTVTDFLGGCIQLYLITWFTEKSENQ